MNNLTAAFFFSGNISAFTRIKTMLLENKN